MGEGKVVEIESRGHVQAGFRVNGEEVEASFAPFKTLLEVLREDLGLTGTKHGCELGECGACAVLVDGVPVLSCLMLAVECAGRAIETVEGLARGAELHPLQAAFADHGGAQCGYCTPGILMTAKALLDAEAHPSRDRIREAISGNLCRCTGYLQIYESIEEGARRMREGAGRSGDCGGCGGAAGAAEATHEGRGRP
jgi:carbon-monoxide dehydrogenase small subunit